MRRDGVREPIRVDIPNPTSVAVARDGSLLIAEDQNGVIYRVRHGNTR